MGRGREASVKGSSALEVARDEAVLSHMACVSQLTILSRSCLARAAPIAVLTSFSSSGGGSAAGRPKDSTQSSRAQPVV